MKTLLKVLEWFTIKKENIPFLLFIYSIIIINYIFYGIITKDLPLFFIVCEFFPAYIIVLGKQMLQPFKILSKIYNILIFLWLSFFFLVDFYCVNALNGLFSSPFAFLMLESNPNEALEFSSLFFSHLFSIRGIILLGVVSFLFIAYYFLAKRKIQFPKIFQILFLVTAIFSISLTCKYEISTRNSSNGLFLPPSTTNLFYKTSVFFKLKPAPDLHKFYTSPKLTFCQDSLPKNIVVIIGESFSKSNSSLYNYDKVTNPYLQKLEDDKSLFVFDSVIAPAIQTVPAFKFFMSEYNRKNEKKIEWYKCTTIPEIFHLMGYSTYWISNQRTKGFNDNVCTKYAELCDYHYFLRNEESYFFTPNSYDEILLSQYDKILNKNNEHNMYFFHLMGSHPLYKERYPNSFKKFSSTDYLNRFENQRENLADYDNSIAYNDSVVYEIIKRFSNSESLVVYFSDHGQDLYQSDPNYTGHAKSTPQSAKFGMDIPFIIYTSPLWQQKHTTILSQITNNIHTQFSTENLMYCLMDLVNAKFLENNKVEKFTLFQNK